MGGSKVSSKIGIIENLLGKVDKLILCGGMTYTFAKAHGGEIGDSIVELDKLDVALGVEELAKKNGVELVLGTDCTATNGLDFDTMTVKPGSEIITCPANNVPAKKVKKVWIIVNFFVFLQAFFNNKQYVQTTFQSAQGTAFPSVYTEALGALCLRGTRRHHRRAERSDTTFCCCDGNRYVERGGRFCRQQYGRRTDHGQGGDATC